MALITDIHTQRSTAENVMFGFREPQSVNQSKFEFQNIDPKQYFLYNVWIRESKKNQPNLME